MLRDRSRNVLYDHLGQDEDKAVSTVRPDCADFVYFLRAYFAYKMGLPFGYSNCSRGGGGSAPHCNEWFDMLHPESTRPARVQDASSDAKPAPRARRGALRGFAGAAVFIGPAGPTGGV